MQSQPTQWIGKTLEEDFLIESKIGQGGFALVFRAKQRSLLRDVVIKLLRPELAAEEALVERFRRESRLAAKLTHPNIATIYHTGLTPEGIPFFAMELIEGLPLSKLLKRETLSPKRAARILRQVAEALDFAHEQGVTHRDLKPDNIMVTSRLSEDHVKLLDFGIAREEGGKNLTKTGELIGTPEYMSPEQSEGQRVGKASDIYSLGVVAFELLTRRVPFSGSPVKILLLHATQPPPSLSEVVKEAFPRTIEDCVAKALSKHPAHRHETAGAFAIALYTAIDVAGELMIPSPEVAPILAPDAKTLLTPPPEERVTLSQEAGATLQMPPPPVSRSTAQPPDTKAPTLQRDPTPKKKEAQTQPMSKTKRPPTAPPFDNSDFARYAALLIFGLAFIVLIVLLYVKNK